ncbi:ATP-binding protein [Treponema vincentii]|uniref:AAA family ATPase n=1 Tax=Treponema vincentii TaxID=69710 RepID=UPI0020A2A8A6|nr:ATP-binding protein [Treponema vincentii]UTC45483.1 ATP-binding protein [Treponema vincentii]
MLIDFTVSNYQSIKEAQTFSFVSESRTEDKNAVFNLENNTIKLYPFSIIYGPNASGKSKFISALDDLCNFVKESYKYEEGADIPAYKPFLLDREYINKPTHFEIEYEIDSARYLYILEIGKNIVLKEELYLYSYNKRASKSAVFKREIGKAIYYGSLFSGSKKALETFLLSNQSLLSRTGNSNNDSLKSPYQFFKEEVDFYKHKSDEILGGRLTTILLERNDKFKQTILKFLHAADIQIEDLKIEHTKKSEILEYIQNDFDNLKNDDIELLKRAYSAEPKMAHKLIGSDINDLVYFDLATQESAGTKKLYDLAAYIVESLFLGTVLVIDEFNNGLHPVIQKMIIDMYLDPEINILHAQLLVTSHDTFIMDSCELKREQIWFTDKNNFGATELYCLNEFDKNLIRDYVNYGKYYFDGRFKALPAISKINLK